MESNGDVSSFREALARQQRQDSPYRFKLELGLFVLLLFGSFMVLTKDPNYNTLFLDEAIYVVAGEDLLQGDFSRNTITYHFGSYLYPVVSASINKMGGVMALRLASGVLVSLATVFVYLTTRMLFGHIAALFSLLLFSFSGVILKLGQLAVYDALALPFLAAALFFLIAAATSKTHPGRLLLAAAVSAILATLSKYIGLIYLPALFITALTLFWLKGSTLRVTLRKLFLYFVLPIQQVLSLYAVFYWQELVQVFQGQGFSLTSREWVLKTIGEEMSFILLLSLVGIVLLINSTLQNPNFLKRPLLWRERPWLNWYTLPPTYRLLFFVFLLVLCCTWLAAPLHHWLTANSRSLWKNCTYSLIFLSPLAGYGLDAFVVALRPRNRVISSLGFVVLCAGLFYFANHALEANRLFRRSWPNVAGAVAYLRTYGLNENSQVLAEAMDVYEYYLSFGEEDHKVWHSFWYMEYKGLSGEEGALAAIRDRAPDFVIIEDYYFADIRQSVIPLLIEAGYVVGWQEEQHLDTGRMILLQVFIRGKDVVP